MSKAGRRSKAGGRRPGGMTMGRAEPGASLSGAMARPVAAADAPLAVAAPRLDEKPLVLFNGNCQAQHLSTILRAAGLADAYHVGGDLGFLPTHDGQVCHYVPRGQVAAVVGEALARGRPVYRALQATSYVERETQRESFAGQTVIAFPFPKMYAMTPSVWAEKHDPGRMFEIDLAEMRRSQSRARSPIDFAAAMREGLRTRSLFTANLHLGGELTGLLVRAVGEAIPEIPGPALDKVVRAVSQGEGMNFITHHPVPDAWQARLGFNWGGDYALFSAALEMRDAQDWPGLLAHRGALEDAFADNSIVLNALALAQLQSGRLDEADALFERLLALSPGYRDFWYQWMDVGWRSSNMGIIDRVMERCRLAFRGHRLHEYIAALVALRRGRVDEAEGYAQTFLAATPERAEGVVPMAKVLIARGNAAGAEALILGILRGGDPSMRRQMASMVSMVPEIQERFTAEVAKLSSASYRTRLTRRARQEDRASGFAWV